MGNSTSSFRLPVNPTDAIRTLNTELDRIEASINNIAMSYTTASYVGFFENLSSITRDLMQYQAEYRARKDINDVGNSNRMVTLSERISTIACSAISHYMRKDPSILNATIPTNKTPYMKRFIGIFKNLGGRPNPCMLQLADEENERRRLVAKGFSIVKQNPISIPTGYGGPYYQRHVTKKKKTTTRRK